MGALITVPASSDFDSATGSAIGNDPTGWEGSSHSGHRLGPVGFLWAAVATTAVGLLILVLGLNAWVQLAGYLFNGVASLMLLAMARRSAVIRSAREGIAPPPSFHNQVVTLAALNALAAVGHAYMIALNYA